MFGFCDVISQVARKRGLIRDSADREDIEDEFRLTLIERRAKIEKGIREQAVEQRIDAGDPDLARNYVRAVFENLLKDRQQKASAGKVRRNTVVSLSDEGLPIVTRKHEAHEDAGDALTSLTGGDIAPKDDDFTLDGKDVLIQDGPDESEDKPKRGKKRSEAGQLFDKMTAAAATEIASLTGGRQDGHDIYLDLHRMLSRLPEDQRLVFDWLWLENGQLLARARTYSEVQQATNLSLQAVRTLEFKALQALKPALGPSFFKRKS